MAAANSSSGVGAVRPNVPQSENEAIFRVTVDNALTFEFPTLAMAEAFAADYGPGCDIESHIPPGPAADDPVASGEAEPVDPASCAADTGIPVSGLSGQSEFGNGNPAETEQTHRIESLGENGNAAESAATGQTHPAVGVIVMPVTWHCLEHRGETIFASQNIKATKRQQRLAGIGTLTVVTLPPGEEPVVDDKWPAEIQRLGIERGFLAPREPEPQSVVTNGNPAEPTHRTVWTVRRGRAIVFTDPEKHACQLLQQRLGFGDVVRVKLAGQDGDRHTGLAEATSQAAGEQGSWSRRSVPGSDCRTLRTHSGRLDTRRTAETSV